MTPIHSIPLDTWTRIMLFLDETDLVNNFEILFKANVFDIPESERLNTFWIITSQARYMRSMEEFSSFPDHNCVKHTFNTLINFGLTDEYACQIVRESNGSILHAMTILGWD